MSRGGFLSRLTQCWNRRGTVFQRPLKRQNDVAAIESLEPRQLLAGIVVTTTSDVIDANDGVTSLREALIEARGTSEADTITFGGSVFTDSTPDTITLNTELLIDSDVTISGTGADLLTIDGNQANRVFTLYNYFRRINVTISGMTITGGDSTANSGRGGAIANAYENLAIDDCVITGNKGYNGGAVGCLGGALHLRRTTISGNEAVYRGGGIWTDSTYVVIEDCTISGNASNEDGGGVFLTKTAFNSSIKNSTISGNRTFDHGGGIYFFGAFDGDFTIENCTISGNQGRVGAGIYLYNPDKPTRILSTTVYGNTATVQGGGLEIRQPSSTVDVVNSIFAGNDEAGATSDLIIVRSGSLGKFQNNIIESMPTGTLDAASVNTGNLIGVDLQLAPLADNGGLTKTHAIAADSIARNAGISGTTVLSDQRGVLRGDPPDIGAYEFSAPILASLETNPLYFKPGQGPTAVTATLTVSAGQDLNGATVEISAGFQAGDVLNFTNTGNITGTFNPQTRTLSLTGVDTAANYQAALRSITYSCSSQSPAARTVSFQVAETYDTSLTVSRDIGGFGQVKDSQLFVFGTDLVNNIRISMNGTLNLVVDGILTTLNPADVTSITIFGNGGDDSIIVDSLPANVTSVTVYGMEGNDSIRVNSAVTNRVILNGGGGNDLLRGGGGNDELTGGLGHDWLNGGGGSDFLQGNSGDDVYEFSDATANEFDTLRELSGEGRDLLNFGPVTTAVTANLLNQTVASMGHRLVKMSVNGQQSFLEDVTGGAAADSITGNDLVNVLRGGGGNDILRGQGGNDELNGEEGHDVLFGGNDDDILLGGNGNDVLNGDAGHDFLDGGEGNDLLAGGTGNDVMLFGTALANQTDTITEVAGGGIDTLNFQTVTTAVTANLTGSGLLASMAGRLINVSAAGVAAEIENVFGGSGDDILTGNGANNLLKGNGGNDTLTGNGGNDILLGGQGNDTLKGVSGRNMLFGGAGADILQGGSAGDLLLSGSYIYENDEAVLRVLQAEWASGDTYQLRIDRLLGRDGSGQNVGFFFNSSSVIDDSVADFVRGNAEQDWFLASTVADVLQDQAVDEVFTQIDTF